MKGIIYVPYANGSCITGFNYDKPLSAKQYIQMEKKEYDDHTEGIDVMMDRNTGRFGNNLAINFYQKRRYKYNHQEYDYHQCDCYVLDIDGKPQSFDELQHLARTGEQFVLKLNLNHTKLKNDVDLETDIKMWINESNKVIKCEGLSDVEVMYHLPKKDLKLSVPDKNTSFVLKDCKFLEVLSLDYINSFAILVNKIIQS